MSYIKLSDSYNHGDILKVISGSEVYKYLYNSGDWVKTYPSEYGIKNFDAFISDSYTINEDVLDYSLNIKKKSYDSMYFEALTIAYNVLRYTKNQYGVSYYEHAVRTALNVAEPEEKIAALLMDIFKFGITPNRLKIAGINDRIIHTIELYNQIMDNKNINDCKLIAYKQAVNIAVSALNTELSYPPKSKDYNAANDFIDKKSFCNKLKNYAKGENLN